MAKQAVKKKKVVKKVADTIISTNPANGSVLGEIPVTGPEEMAAAYKSAKHAQTLWGCLTIKERAKHLLRYKEAILENVDELTQLISKETGKTINEALSLEIFPAVALIDHFCNVAEDVLKPEEIKLYILKHKKSYIHYKPLGVIGVISPWNVPFAITTGELIMSLIAGNSVVLKPSEITTLISLESKRIFDSVVPIKDVYQVTPGYGETGQLLIDSGVNKVVFTGSGATGAKVAEGCARNLIPCTLELGGKSPGIVTDDIDLERTVHSIVWGAFANSGQICASLDRLYVNHKVYGSLVSMIIRECSKLRQGNPLNFDTDVGSMTFEPQLQRITEHIEDAVAKGAKIVCGGSRPKHIDQGMFFEPTVLTDVDHTMRIMKEESFGPILAIMKVQDDWEALRLSNDSHLGLNGYVFCRDIKRARFLAEQVECGTVQINDTLSTYGCCETPWAGLKSSGIGRVHSDQGLKDLCQKRHVNYNSIPTTSKEFWYYPYSRASFDLLKSTLKVVFKSKVGPIIKNVLKRVG